MLFMLIGRMVVEIMNMNKPERNACFRLSHLTILNFRPRFSDVFEVQEWHIIGACIIVTVP
jgi:hypothetical protein